MPGYQAQKIPRMAVGITHHWRNGDGTVQHARILPDAAGLLLLLVVAAALLEA
jgi:hypothetical protein